MGDVGRGGGVGGGAHTSLIGVKAPLDALHHGGGAETGGTAEDGLHVEGGGEDALEHLGQHTDVQDHDDQGHDDVQHAHDGHQHAGDLDDALAAAHDADTHQNGQQSAADHGHQADGAAHQGDGVGIEAVAGHAVDQVEGGQHIKAAGISGDEGHGEDHAQEAALQSGLDVVGGAAVAAAVGVPLFIDLGQGALHKGGGPAHQGDEPHPEHGAIAADGDGVGHAHDVARAHPAGSGDHQRLEGGDGVLVVRLLAHHPDGLPQQPQLNEFAAAGEVNSGGQQQDDEQIAVHKVADVGDEPGKACVQRVKHEKFPRFLSLYTFLMIA